MLWWVGTPTYQKQPGEDSLPAHVSWTWWVAYRVETTLCWWWWCYLPQLQPLLVLLTCFCPATPLSALLTHGKDLHRLFQTTPVPLSHMPAAQFVSPVFGSLLPSVHQPSLLGGKKSLGDANGHFTCDQKPCDSRQGRHLLKVHLVAERGRRKPPSCGLGSAQFVWRRYAMCLRQPVRQLAQMPSFGMGKLRLKVTQGHRQQKSSLFRRQTQSFSSTERPLQCFIGDIKDSPQPLSAGMMLQHGVHISKQCNRSSLLSSHLPPPCP